MACGCGCVSQMDEESGGLGSMVDTAQGATTRLEAKTLGPVLASPPALTQIPPRNQGPVRRRTEHPETGLDLGP